MVILRCSIVVLLILVCPNQYSFAGNVTDTLTTEVVQTRADATKSQLHNSVAEHESSDDCSSNENHKNGTNGTGCDDDDDESDDKILGIATITILTILVIVSIVFEKLKEYALEETSRLVVPVVQSAFGELTVLGFITIIVFIMDFKVHVDSSSLLELVVVNTLHRDMSEELEHLTELLHMSVFLVMIMFIIQIGIMVAVASGMGKKWTHFEYQRDRVDGVVNEYRQAKASGCRMRSRSKQLLEELEYHSLRQAFIHPRVGAAFDKCSAPRPAANVKHDFDFSAYLSQGLSVTLCEMVELGLLGWLTLWVVTVFFWSFRYVDGLIEHHVGECPVATTCVLAVSGYLLPLLLWGVSCKLAAAKKQLLPPRHQLYLKQHDIEDPLLDTPHSDSGHDHTLDIPSYLHLSPAKPFFICCKKHKGTRHDNLFWFGPLGVEFLRLFFSVELLLCSSYWGANIALIPMVLSTDCHVPLAYKILLTCVVIPPPIIVLMSFVDVMGDFVLTSFVEEKRDRHKTKEVLLSMKGRKVFRMLKLINAMHHACMRNNLEWFLEDNEHEHDHDDLVAVPLRITRCRKRFKPIPGRHLDWTDRCEGSTSHLQHDIESGEIKLPHVPVYVRSTRLSEMEGRSVYFKFEQSARLDTRTTDLEFQMEEAMETYSSIFDAIDRDGSGSIVHAELIDLMKDLGFATVSAQTVTKLIARLDVDDNGVIDKSEFLAFFRHQMSRQSQESTHQVLHNIFRYLDSDHSGTVSTAEFEKVISKLDNGSLTRDDVEEIVRMADENGDGEISLHELTHLIEDITKGHIM